MRAGDLRQEIKPMFTLAVPVVITELGWMAMGIVDTLMVGRVSPEAIGAVGLGSMLFFAVAIFAMGVLLGLDTLVAQAFGAGRLDECHRWLLHGVVLSLILSVPLTALLLQLPAALAAWGLHPAVLALAAPYIETVTWSLLPLLLFASFRRYLQGMGVVRSVMIALVAANVINAITNWVLIFGKFGAPALGVRGAAWATTASRIFMAAFLLAVILIREHGRRPGLFHTPLKIESARLRRLFALGFPAAMQATLEVGVFAAATAVAGRLPPASLAAHQIALNVAGCSFMVPFGISSAGAVRVGHAIGRGDPSAAARAGWTALLFGATFMAGAALAFVLFARPLIGAFTSDSAVLHIGTSLVLVAAIFQLFDGLQSVATGALRGLGDTRSPMLWNLGGHWLIGLPLGYALCFSAGLGVTGLWWGFSSGLMICGVALVIVWSRSIHRVALDPRTFAAGPP